MPQLKYVVFIFFVLCSFTAWASIAATAHWNVRTDGANTNGGFFDPAVASPGTDYSAQAAAQLSFADIVVGGTTSTFTSSAHPATAAYPGNGLYISGGSGCTVGWYEILSESGVTYTVDRSLGTTASTCTGKLGGGLATLQTAMTNGVASNFIYVKSGTYTFTSTYTIPVSGYVAVGYGSTYNDGGTRPQLIVSGISSLFATPGNNTTSFRNITFTGNGSTGPGIYATGHSGVLNFVGCYISGFGSGGTDNGGFIDQTNSSNDDYVSLTFLFDEMTANSSVVTGGSNSVTVIINGSYSHGNVYDLYNATGSLVVQNTIFSSSTGPYSIKVPPGLFEMYNNVFYNAAGSAISGNSAPLYVFVNNIFYGNYQDVDNVNLPITSSATISRNAYGPHTVASVGWYSDPTDIALSANPFVNASSGNFQLNTTVGGGASLIGAGYPLLFGPSTINYLNIGAVQSQSGGGGATVLNAGFAY